MATRTKPAEGVGLILGKNQCNLYHYQRQGALAPCSQQGAKAPCLKE